MTFHVVNIRVGLELKILGQNEHKYDVGGSPLLISLSFQVKIDLNPYCVYTSLYFQWAQYLC